MVVLVRHGQTVWNITNRAQGHVDVELDEKGVLQAELVSQRLLQMDIQKVLSSDLVRSVQTAQAFADKTGLAIEERVDLRERTFGDMEGEDYRDLHVWMRHEGQRLGIPEWEVRPPNGESMADVWTRLEPIVGELRDEGSNVLVVSHGGAMAQLLAKLMHGTHETPRLFRFSNCGVTVLNRREDRSFLLTTFNDCTHLEALSEVATVA